MTTRYFMLQQSLDEIPAGATIAVDNERQHPVTGEIFAFRFRHTGECFVGRVTEGGIIEAEGESVTVDMVEVIGQVTGWSVAGDDPPGRAITRH